MKHSLFHRFECWALGRPLVVPEGYIPMLAGVCIVWVPFPTEERSI